MNITYFPQLVFLCVTLAFCTSGTGQSTKETVILYNSVPVKAEISSDGNVHHIISEEPDFLKGFTLKVQDYGQFLEDNKPKEEVKAQVPSSQSYAIMHKEAAMVRFPATYATLSDEAIHVLNTIVEVLKSEPNTKINLETISKLDSELVSKNRFNSIKTYLKLRGVDTERISFQSLVGEKDVNEVKIYYLK